MQDLQGVGGQGHETLLMTLAENFKPSFGEREILQLELKHFAGAQAVEQHQSDDGQIAKGAKAFPETGHLLSGKGHDHTARLAQSQLVVIFGCRRP